jgi:methylmalonyl-CoA mutase
MQTDTPLGEFPPVSSAEWRAQIIKDLKGEPFESLVWKNENGILVQPFYTHEEVSHKYGPAFTHTSWDVGISAPTGDARSANAYILKKLNEGATSIQLDLRHTVPGSLLRDVHLQDIRTVFLSDIASLPKLKQLELLKKQDVNWNLISQDIMSSDDLHNWIKLSEELAPAGTCQISVDLLHFHNRGCLPYYELAIFLSNVTAILDQVRENSPGKRLKLSVRTGVGTNYFTEIAKLRAIRRLWLLLVEEYQLESGAAIEVLVESSLTNKSLSGQYNNLLRTTIEGMAAVAGGCNNLIVHEFDILAGTPTPFAQRLAVNQQLVLGHESGLATLADVGCGSYYIESLTDMLAEKGLETFKEFEKQGGYFECLKSGKFSDTIAAQAKAAAERIRSGSQVIVGVNRFEDSGEKRKTASGSPKAFSNPVLAYELEKSK